MSFTRNILLGLITAGLGRRCRSGYVGTMAARQLDHHASALHNYRFEDYAPYLVVLFQSERGVKIK